MGAIDLNWEGVEEVKKLIFVGVLCFLVGGAGGYFVNTLFQKKEVPVTDQAAATVTATPDASVETDEQEDARSVKQGSISRIDYPLIDVYFEHDKSYTLELAKFDGEKEKEYTAEGDFFQYNKENFSIITIPSGLGTTPDYVLSVYEGKKRIKIIDCAQVRPGMMDGKW